MKGSLEQQGPATNGAAIDWYRAILSNGKISEDKIKTEAGIFFNLSVEEKAKDKKQFKIHLEGLLKKQKNLGRSQAGPKGPKPARRAAT